MSWMATTKLCILTAKKLAGELNIHVMQFNRWRILLPSAHKCDGKSGKSLDDLMAVI
jgi:hypothetical protein